MNKLVSFLVKSLFFEVCFNSFQQLYAFDLIQGYAQGVTDSLEVATVGDGFFSVLGFAFVAGLLTTLSSLIYPIIPVTVGVITAQGPTSIGYNFILSCFYVFGIALTYGLLGYNTAITGKVFDYWMSNELVIGLVVVMFLYLAFSMFGFYEVGIPSWIWPSSKSQKRGSFFGTFIFGVLSGFIFIPTVVPALPILMAYVSNLSSMWSSLLVLFSFAFGMSFILILLGTFAGMLRYFPYASEWMIFVERFFGFVILYLGVSYLDPLLARYSTYFLYAVISLFASVYYLISMRTAWIQRCKCDIPINGQEEIHNRRRIGKIVLLEVCIAIVFFFAAIICLMRGYANYRGISENKLIYRLATTPPYRWPYLYIWKKLK